MTVTDDQVAALRAQLRGDRSEHERLRTQLDASDSDGYVHLIGAAFVIAAERQFQQNSTAADVIRFIADVRGQTPLAAERIDPKIGEQLIISALTDEPVAEEVDADTALMTELLLLVGMVASEHFQSADLDHFMDEARALANEWASPAS